MLVQTKSFRCPAEHCVFVYIGKTPPAILWAPHFVRAVGGLRRFVPSHIHMELVMHKNRLSLVRPRRRGVPSAHPIGLHTKLVKLARPLKGVPTLIRCTLNAGMHLVTPSQLDSSVQILDLHLRLASTDRVSERKIRGRIFRPANTWCNNLFIFTETL